MSEFDRRLAKENNGEAQKAYLETTLSPFMNWHKFLTAAPASIAILGKVLLVAGEKDFTLEHAVPSGGFKYIKYPGSFRASLVHLVSDSHKAMMKSHTNMDSIKLHTAQVPNYMKESVKILAQGTREEMDGLLPGPLKKIGECALACEGLALEVEQCYVGVNCLISELLEATTGADGHYKTELRKTSAAQRLAKMEEEERNERKEQSEKQVEKMEEEVLRKQRDLKEAFESQPSGWDLVAMGAVQDLSKGLASALEVGVSALATRINPVGGALAVGSKAAGAAPEETAQAPPEETEAAGAQVEMSQTQRNKACPTIQRDSTALQTIQRVKHLSTTFQNFITKEGGLNKDAILEEGSGAEIVQTQLERISKQLNQEGPAESPARAEVIQMCQEGCDITKEFLSLATSLCDTPAKIEELKSKMTAFCNQALMKSMKASAQLCDNPMSPPGPRQQMAGKGAKSAVECVVEQGREKIETHKGLLEVAQNRYDAAVKQQREASKDLLVTLKELESLSMDKLNFEEILDVLRRAIILLASLKKEWSNLALFFSSVANIVKVTLKNNLTHFKDTSENQKKLLMNGCTYSDLMRDMIYSQAMQSNMICYFINHVATSYGQISSDHIMPQAAELFTLLSLDPVEDRGKIKQEGDKLTSNCELAQNAIASLVDQDRDRFMANIERRRQRVDTELGSLLAAPDQGTVAAIREAVEAVKTEEDINLDDFN